MLTPSYGRLLSIAGTMTGAGIATQRVLNGMVSLEFGHRVDDFAAAIRDLEEQDRRWGLPGVLAVAARRTPPPTAPVPGGPALSLDLDTAIDGETERRNHRANGAKRSHDVGPVGADCRRGHGRNSRSTSGGKDPAARPAAAQAV